MKLGQLFVVATVALASTVSAADPNSQSVWELAGFDKNPARFDQTMDGVYRGFAFDQDGNITPESFHKTFEAAKKQGGMPASVTEQNVVEALDANGDGKVNKRELREFIERALRETTADKLKDVKQPSFDAKSLIVRDFFRSN
jgi:hypothetical protein